MTPLPPKSTGRFCVWRFPGRWVGFGPIEKFGLEEEELLPGYRLGWTILSRREGSLRDLVAEAVEEAVAKVRVKLRGEDR